MKSFAIFAVLGTLGFVAYVFADASGQKGDLVETTSASSRFAIHGEGDQRLMIDTQTGETWVMKSVLRATMEADPSPIVVWFPVPRADSRLSKQIVKSRLSQLKFFRDSDLAEAKRQIAEDKQEYGADHERVLAGQMELDNAGDSYGLLEDELILPLFDR